ncbi:MAG: hypothetical protein Q8P05_06145 [Candidatus Diapherotrites archaeon]|nr:hypothetical protein [Candidatus Diapherotrites archaeon]
MGRRIVFRIGGNPREDLKAVFQNPKLIKVTSHVIYFKDWKSMLEALSPQKLHLLQQLIEYDDEKPLGVSQLAKKTKRKQESISRDLNALEKSHLIVKSKKGKYVYPKLNAKEIVIQLA